MRTPTDDVYIPPEDCLVTLRFVVDAPLSPPPDLRPRQGQRQKTLRGLSADTERRILELVTRSR